VLAAQLRNPEVGVAGAAEARALIILSLAKTQATNRSGGEAFVAMMQSTDLPHRDNLASFVWVDRGVRLVHEARCHLGFPRTAPRVRACLVERSEFELPVPVLELPDDSSR
jgi:hypothetical protein